jgi:single-strand DNA-binding protein
LLYIIIIKFRQFAESKIYNMGILSGRIIKIGETEQIKETFKKRLLVVETDGEYPQSIPVEFVQDRTDLLNDLTVGDSVAVSYNLRGRKWNDKYFLNLDGWKIEKTGSAPAPVNVPVDDVEDGEDLPF